MTKDEDPTESDLNTDIRFKLQDLVRKSMLSLREATRQSSGP
jgi:hypothetical protein